MQFEHVEKSIVPSRNSISVLDFLSSRPEITCLVRTICVRFDARDFRKKASAKARKFLETFIFSLTSLVAVYATIPLLRSSLRHVLSQPTLRIFTECFHTTNQYFEDSERFIDLEACGLDPFWLGLRPSAIQFLSQQRRVKHLQLESVTTIYDQESDDDDASWLSPIDELALLDSFGNLVPFMVAQMTVSRSRIQICYPLSPSVQNSKEAGNYLALRELFIICEFDKWMPLNEIVSGFSACDLQRLMLYDVVFFRWNDLQHLAQTSPHLVELVLIAISMADISDLVCCFLPLPKKVDVNVVSYRKCMLQCFMNSSACILWNGT